MTILSGTVICKYVQTSITSIIRIFYVLIFLLLNCDITSLIPVFTIFYPFNSLISQDEFRSFASLLSTPDAIPRLAFKLFDLDNEGQVSFGEYHSM